MSQNPVDSHAAPKPSGIYRLTSIARPVDPRYPTNRALLVLLPLLALATVGLRSLLVLDGSAISIALDILLVGFAAWALTRELAPDDNAAAFLALAVAWLAYLFFGAASVLLPFVALFIVRIVNRSTGLPARPFDTLSILGFCIWAALNLQQPLILLLATAAFVLNATLKDPQPYHYWAGLVCLVVFCGLLIRGAPLLSGDLSWQDGAIVVALAAAIILTTKQAGEPVSVCDVYSRRLDAARVNAGLVLGFLLGVQALLTEGSAAWLNTPIWACLIAVPVSLFVRRALEYRA